MQKVFYVAGDADGRLAAEIIKQTRRYEVETWEGPGLKIGEETILPDTEGEPHDKLGIAEKVWLRFRKSDLIPPMVQLIGDFAVGFIHNGRVTQFESGLQKASESQLTKILTTKGIEHNKLFDEILALGFVAPDPVAANEWVEPEEPSAIPDATDEELLRGKKPELLLLIERRKLQGIDTSVGVKELRKRISEKLKYEVA